MSAEGRSFELGGVVVPLTAALGLQQSISRVSGGSSTRRTMNGTAIHQANWRKLAINLSGDGWAPLGIGALDYDDPAGLTLKCGLPCAVRSQSNVIALPVKRRTDAGYEPFARAHLADGREVDTPLSIVSHTATLTTVAGAIGYAVWYFPQLVVIAAEPEETFDGAGAASSWQLTAEEL